MNLLNVMSFILFLVFVVSYFTKLYILSRRHRIIADVLGKKGKSKQIALVEFNVKLSSLSWAIVWFFHSLLGKSFVESWSWKAPVWIHIAGIIVTGLGVTVFVTAMVHMRSSWRVGIDKSTATELVTTGIYRYSRNPAFLGFDFMFIGLFLMYPGAITLIVMLWNLISFHCLILQEEKHLNQAFGTAYGKYAEKTPRYCWFV